MKSRHASAASTSTSPLAAASRAPCTASPGRSSVFDGMHAQYEHSPPTSSRSTSATRSPPLGQGAGAVLAGRASAQHDDVVLVAHGDLCCRSLEGQRRAWATPVAPVESLANARVFAHAWA